MTQTAQQLVDSSFARGEADFRTYHKSSITIVQQIKQNCTDGPYIEGMMHAAEVYDPSKQSHIRKVAEMFAARKQKHNSPMHFEEARAMAYKVMPKKKSGRPEKSKDDRAATYYARGVKQFGKRAMDKAAANFS